MAAIPHIATASNSVLRHRGRENVDRHGNFSVISRVYPHFAFSELEFKRAERMTTEIRQYSGTLEQGRQTHVHRGPNPQNGRLLKGRL